MVGLIHPRDLTAWNRWQAQQQPLARRARSLLARARARTSPGWLTTQAEQPDVLIGLESRSTGSVRALLDVVPHVAHLTVGVLSPVPVRDLLPDGDWQERPGDLASLTAAAARSDAVALSTGHYLVIGAELYAALPHRFLTVQHGLLTPHAPPLAPGTTLLAWSSQDADFWLSGRSDVSVRVVGASLLAATGAPARDLTGPVSFLGQLHGAELPRDELTQVTEAFLLRHGAVYRPHPAERTRHALAMHTRWERLGITIDRSSAPLSTMSGPVVSIFSTGVLEAAAHGIPAYVHHDSPPPWLREFWRRYGLQRLGDSPTPPLPQPSGDPVLAVASAVAETLGR